MTIGLVSQQALEVAGLADRAGLNRVTNPSAEVNTTGMGPSGGTTLTRSNEQAWVGAWSYKAVRLTPASGSLFIYSVPLTGLTLTGIAHLLTWKVRYWAAVGASHNGRIQINVNYSSGSADSPTQNLPAPNGRWQQASVSVTTDPARTIVGINAYPYVANVVEATTAYFDGLDFRVDELSTDSYIDGDQGAGYAWTGVAHNSTSTRTGVLITPAQISQQATEMALMRSAAPLAQMSQVAVEVAIAAPPALGRTQIVTIG